MSFSEPKTFSFTPENVAQIQKILAKYPAGKGESALLPVLRLAQKQSGGWLPRAAIAAVAQLLEIPAIRAFEVASFYTMFNLEPVGKYLVQLCRTTPCWLAGGEAVAQAVMRRLGIEPGQTTPDGLFTLKEVECLGACVNAPVMQINEDMFEDLTAESACQVLDDLAAGRKPKVGPQKERCGSCPCGGPTTLKQEGGAA